MRIFLLIFFTTFNFSLFAQNVSVTLMVDMQNQTVSNSGVFVAGGFNSWSTNTTSLSDIDGDQVYEVTLNLSSNSGHEFKFINGSSWENNLSGSCANNFGSGPNRWLSVGTINQVEPAYQFGSCNVVVFYGCTDSLANNFNPNATNDDGSCDYTIFGCTDSLANNYSPLATSDDSSCTYDIVVTFNVDMSNESISNNGVHLAGSFNGWSTDSTEMFDLDGDSIYSTSILLNQNTYYEYKFINGNTWSSAETLLFWQNCINSSTSNRMLITDTFSTQQLLTVCFSSCAICPIYGCTDSLAINFDSSATVSDSSCIYNYFGCTDSLACNYNIFANVDDGSCYNLNVFIGNDTTICSSSNLLIQTNSIFDSYLWNNFDTNRFTIINSPGTYFVSVFDSNGCEASDTINIFNHLIPLVDIGNDPTICDGDSLVLDAGNNWDSYLWSDSSINQTLTIVTSGQYSVIVTDSNGCTGFDYINVTLKYKPISDFTYSITGNNVLFINNSTNALNYIWDFYSNGSQIDSSLDAAHTYPNVGTFVVTLKALNECGFDTTSKTINILSTFEENIIDNLKIYPNPFSQNVKINNFSIFKEFELYNTQSKLVLKQDLNKDLTDLNLSVLPKGTYLLKLIGLQKNYTIKLIKK